ncbi:hypothetical protein OPHB3_3886 [Oceanobacillus picturae]|uniref:Uncharacterized protein n=1 Tax=Oceanobacillus picturae TaxID=171693 RepID=A0A0U9I2F6_9BACI|nr:DUF5702 domain-containing protein [Oceanobacillus picturae]GAQ19901.1 hypothetical protein OPHB3_3886 [Oceanobacillus picturae]
MKKGIKKFIHKFIMDDKGAVSIYLIIITLLLFLFNAVLIDYARILVAERQTEQAAKVALRSTMSSYNQGLQDKGLFAFDGDQGQSTELFKKVFAKNLEPGDGEGFKFVDVQPEESEITTELNLERGLSNKDILEYQILEDMKYKAPIEIGEAILENFLSISDEMEKASVYVDVIGEIEEDVEERENKLDEAKKLIEEAKDILDGINSKVTSQNSSSYPAVNNLQDIFTGHTKYLDAYPINPPNEEDDDDKSDEEKENEEKDKEDADKFKTEATNLLTKLVDTSNSAKGKLEEALVLVQDAEELNGNIRTTIENAEDSKGESYNDAQNESQNGIDLGDDSGLDNAFDSVNDYVLDDGFFTNLKGAVQQAIDELDEDDLRTDQFIPKINEIKEGVNDGFHSKRHNELSNGISQASDYYENTNDHIDEAIQILEEGRAEFKDQALEEEEEKADSSLEDVKNEMDEIQKTIGDLEGDIGTYKELEELVLKYNGAIERNGESYDLENRDATADEAMSFIDTLFKNLGEKLVSARDELYINEYVLTRFKSHEFSSEGSSSYTFENNQVEYIIYGHESFGANYMAAMSEIFALRFAINFVSAMMSKENKVFGPYAWVAGLTSAFAQTVQDITMLSQGESIQLFPGKRPRTVYKDYLRLFLFAHPEGKKTERIMAVLDYETETDLTESSSYITGRSTSSLRLWFLPGVAEMLGESGIIPGRVEGNRFYIEKEINYSY